MSILAEAQGLVDQVVEEWAKATGARPSWASGPRGYRGCILATAAVLTFLDLRYRSMGGGHEE